VERRAIADMLSTAGTARLILVRAPAGFGKTTVMLQYLARLREAGIATAWLTLDHADNDGPRFLASLDAALAQIVPARTATTAADAAPGAIGDAVLQLMDRVAHYNAPFALFIDDFEVLQEGGGPSWMREIVEHLPCGGELVVGSRSVPDLALGRLRARGHLLEIDTSALRFSYEETVEFFRAASPMSLSSDDVLRLHNKTEGWPAALWLASASLARNPARSEFVRSFSHTDRSIAEYLAEDVIASQPEAIRHFMLRTSILRYLSLPLCQALVPDADCEAILHRLETASLISPIEGDDRTWRFHSLIAGYLREQLRREVPEEAVSQLHRAAADWYLSQGRAVPAIDHTIESRDFARAKELLRQQAQSLLRQGRMRLVTRWLDAVPEDWVKEHPHLQVLRTWALAFTRGPWEAMDFLDRADLDTSDDIPVRHHVHTLRPLLLSMMDRFEEAFDSGRQSLAQWPTGRPFADMVLGNAMANVFAVMGKNAESRGLLETARRIQGEAASSFNLMYSETVEGIIDLQQGRLREATARFSVALTRSSASHYGQESGNAWAGVMYAASVYEGNDLKLAEHLLRVYMPLARDVGLTDHVTLGYLLLSRAAFARGDVDRAFEILTELEYLGHTRHLARMVAGAKLERARVLLMQGHVQAAKEQMGRGQDASLWERVQRLHLLANDLDYFELAELRWEALAGDARVAVQRLGAAADAAQAGDRLRRAMKLRLLRCLAQQRAGESSAAQAGLAALLKETCTAGFVRLLLDEGERVGMLLRQLDKAMQNNDAARRDPAFSAYVQRLVQASGPAVEIDDAPAGEKPVLLDPLTPKELRVLQLLAEGYSNSAIAEKLFVSDSTVRTHLRNINNKVSAHNRTQAVSIARRLGLVH
jgi:LuxR family maltose regulon positive regulatory protein